MTTAVKAIYEHGVFKPKEPVTGGRQVRTLGAEVSMRSTRGNLADIACCRRVSEERAMKSPSLREAAESDLRAAGLGPPKLVRDSGDFENGEVVFIIGVLRLRLVRDRGQEFIDLASSAEPERFFFFDDVELAMGWKTTDAVVTKQSPEDVRTLLARIKQRQDELDQAFSAPEWTHTAGKLESAAKLRGGAFLGRLQQLARSS